MDEPGLDPIPRAVTHAQLEQVDRLAGAGVPMDEIARSTDLPYDIVELILYPPEPEDETETP